MVNSQTEKSFSQNEQTANNSLLYLNIAQFIGAMNDNVFKLLLVYFLIEIWGASSSTTILSIAGAVYVLPFLIFSTSSGIIADHYSKSRIIVTTKIAELCILLFGMVAFFLHNSFLSFFTLFLLSVHSTIFGPCKYGIIPEIVPKSDISRANSILTSCSYIAIIIGTFLASFLTDITHKNFIIALSICAIFSFTGILSALRIQKTKPSGSTKKLASNPISTIYSVFKVARQEPSLLTAMFGSAFFLFIGSFLQLNMIPYAMQVLHISDVQGGYIFLLSAVGIGVGSIVAGKVSGKFVEFGLVPFAGLSMAACCFLLDYYSFSIVTVIAIAFLFGFFGGMYLVPLDSYIQVASPQTYRGQVVATGNFLGFFFVLLSSISLYVIGEVLHIPPDTSFTIIGYITLITASIITIFMYGYLIRFVSFLMSTIFYPNYLKGKELIPLDKPSIFFVPQSMRPWTFVLFASQRRRMRVFTVFDQTSLPFSPFLKRFVYITHVESLSSLEPDGKYSDIISHSLDRGTSIAIFCTKKTVQENKHHFSELWKNARAENAPHFFHVNVPEEGLKTENNVLCAQIEML